MIAAGSTYEHSFELPPAAGPRAPAGSGVGGDSLPEPLLARNALWLCNLRWGATGILVTIGVGGLVTGGAPTVGLVLPSGWPLVMAGILVAANVAFIAHARFLIRTHKRRGATPRGGARLNIWGQMLLDLVAHTFVVHYLGSIETYALFVYLFHILLSCMFFSRRQSFPVAALACALFVLTVGLEAAGVVPASSVYAGAGGEIATGRATWSSTFNVTSAMAIWLVVWYMASYLSALVRRRGAALVETNSMLLEAQEEKARDLMLTAHELKTPFAAIHANTQLLLRGNCGPLTDEAREALHGIASGSRRLLHGINQTLQLASLRSPSEAPGEGEALALDEIVKASLTLVQAAADERNVTVEEDLRPASTCVGEEHLRALLANLLSNAVAYSREGGQVRVTCGSPGDGGPTVTVEDNGIGIPEEELPRVFDEYYRTDEAAHLNQVASGLGLAIVKHIAQSHGIRLRLESAPGKGTRFTLRFPSCSMCHG